MERPRTSLWSRLVMFYSVCKADQLKPEVMAEIVAKYGSKEKELSARLLKKYGRPLPQSVPAEELRQVLARFGMEDEGSAESGSGSGSGASRESAGAREAASARTGGEGEGGEGGAGGGGGGGGKGYGRSTGDAAGGSYSSAAAAGHGSDSRARRETWGSSRTTPPGSDSRARRETSWRDYRSRPPLHADALDFRSKFFEPLEALRHRRLRPPFPREPALDNLFKFRALMPLLVPPPAPAPSPTAATEPAAEPASSAPVSEPGATEARPAESVTPEVGSTAASLSSSGQAVGVVATVGRIAMSTAGSGGVSGSGSDNAAGGLEAGGAKAAEPAPGGGGVNNPFCDVARTGKASSGGETMHQSSAVETQPDVSPGMPKAGAGGSVVGHYGPVSSAIELQVEEKAKAVSRRGAELASMPAKTYGKGRSKEQGGTPVQRIMREYAGPGPYSLLYRLHEEKRRASVMIRRVNSVRGTCTGLIRAFDKHMNLLLADVREEYTVLVPAREPKPLSESVQGAGAKITPDGKTAGISETGGAGGAATNARLDGMDGGGVGAAASTWTLVEIGATGDGFGNQPRADVRTVSLGSREGGGEGGGGSCMDLSSDSGSAREEIEEGEVVDEAQTTSGGKETGHENVVRNTRGGVEREEESQEKVARKVSVEGGRAGRDESDPGGENMPSVDEGSISSSSGDVAKKSAEVCFGTVTTGDKIIAAPDSGEKEPESSATDDSGSKVDDTGTATGEQAAGEDVKSSGNPNTSVPVGAPQEGEDVHETGEAGAVGQEKRPGGRRSRARGPWRGEFKSVRRERYLKQLLIRGDNVVMVWEAPQS